MSLNTAGTGELTMSNCIFECFYMTGYSAYHTWEWKENIAYYVQCGIHVHYSRINLTFLGEFDYLCFIFIYHTVLILTFTLVFRAIQPIQ